MQNYDIKEYIKKAVTANSKQKLLKKYIKAKNKLLPQADDSLDLSIEDYTIPELKTALALSVAFGDATLFEQCYDKLNEQKQLNHALFLTNTNSYISLYQLAVIQGHTAMAIKIEKVIQDSFVSDPENTMNAERAFEKQREDSIALAIFFNHPKWLKHCADKSVISSSHYGKYRLLAHHAQSPVYTYLRELAFEEYFFNNPNHESTMEFALDNILFPITMSFPVTMLPIALLVAGAVLSSLIFLSGPLGIGLAVIAVLLGVAALACGAIAALGINYKVREFKHYIDITNDEADAALDKTIPGLPFFEKACDEYTDTESQSRLNLRKALIKNVENTPNNPDENIVNQEIAGVFPS